MKNEYHTVRLSSILGYAVLIVGIGLTASGVERRFDLKTKIVNWANGVTESTEQDR